MRQLVVKVWDALTHFYGGISRKYYWEDFIRVYPNGIRINRLGWRKPATPIDTKNFLNHQKFYAFAAQFAHNAAAADIGCGSGYGCVLLKNAGAARVCGTDASTHAIRFANDHYGNLIEFSVQGITDMNLYPNDQFDLTICSEVLEHIKEYGKADQAVGEIKRITRPRGIIVIGTPNSELLGDHGFSFGEMEALMKKHFTQYCIFENALVPFGSSKEHWERRLSEGRTGVIVSQAINFDETVLLNGVMPEVKTGRPAGIYSVDNVEVDTALLHNTHSWAIVAIRDAV
jgi:SAM-dependent methyltransferase